jgi:hypothetical protein
MYPKEMKARIQTNTCTPVFIAAMSTIAKRQRPKCPSTDKLINKIWYTHMIIYYSAAGRRTRKETRQVCVLIM